MSKNKDLSFLPTDYVERRIEQRTNLICLTLFGVVIAGVIGAKVVSLRHANEVKQQRAEINAEFADAAARIEKLNTLQRSKDQMLRKAQVTGRLLEPMPRTFLLADLINRMPPTLSLFELELESKVDKSVLPVINRSKAAMKNKGKSKTDKAAEPEPVPQYIVTLKLVGVAPTDVQVAQYMSALSRSELLSDVNLRFSEESKIEDSTMRKFHIDMTLNTDADVRQIQPLLADRELRMNPLDEPGSESKAITLTPEGPKLGGADGGLIQQVNDAEPNTKD